MRELLLGMDTVYVNGHKVMRITLDRWDVDDIFCTLEQALLAVNA